MAIPALHGKSGIKHIPGSGSRSLGHGHIEGKPWDIEQLGLGFKVVVETFDVSTPEGKNSLRHFIAGLRYHILGES